MMSPLEEKVALLSSAWSCSESKVTGLIGSISSLADLEYSVADGAAGQTVVRLFGPDALLLVVSA